MCILLLNNLSVCFSSQYPSKAGFHPSSFIIKTNLSVKEQKITIAADNIEFDTVLEFTQAHRAEMHRSGIAFLQMVGSVQYALKVYTML